MFHVSRTNSMLSHLEGTSHVLGDLNWNYKRIVVLPESIGDLTVGGHLHLNGNKLESLPESFGSLTVDGGLYVDGNPTLTASRG